MAETIQNLHGSPKWHWYNIMEDLKVQGGLEGVVIEPSTVSTFGCGGYTQAGTRFGITWVHDRFMLLSLNQDEPELVKAFSKVLEYQPFCKYVNTKGLLTYEWDRQDPVGRYKELEKKGEKDLEWIGE